jgi:alkylated DNA repair dioxygenase AlkB
MNINGYVATVPDAALPAAQRTSLAAGGFFDYALNWIDRAAADDLERALVEQMSWEEREVELFGKRVVQPRLIAWAGDLPYRYSGQTLETREFPPALAALRDAVRKRSSLEFNHALVNRYRDGNDSMGLHSDAEAELGPNPIVASLSLGATRRFVIRHKREREDRRDLELVHGSLLIMGGTMHHQYRHGLPRTSRPVGQRINVTFRRLLRAPAAP